MTRQALAQAEAWIGEFGSRPSDTVPLRRRQLVTLSTLERRLVALSAAATQGAGVIVVDEADAALSPDGLAELGTVCDRLVQASGSTVILVGAASGVLATGTRTPAHEADPAARARTRWRADPRTRPGVRIAHRRQPTRRRPPTRPRRWT